jgi:hypothetical protein
MPNKQRGGSLNAARGICLAVLISAGFWLALAFFLIWRD